MKLFKKKLKRDLGLELSSFLIREKEKQIDELLKDDHKEKLCNNQEIELDRIGNAVYKCCLSKYGYRVCPFNLNDVTIEIMPFSNDSFRPVIRSCSDFSNTLDIFNYIKVGDFFRKVDYDMIEYKDGYSIIKHGSESIIHMKFKYD